MKRKTHLASFCNIHSVYSPNTGRLTVRHESFSTGKCLSTWSVPLSAERFEELCCDLAEEFNDGTAALFNAYAAKELLKRADAYPRPESEESRLGLGGCV